MLLVVGGWDHGLVSVSAPAAVASLALPSVAPVAGVPVPGRFAVALAFALAAAAVVDALVALL